MSARPVVRGLHHIKIPVSDLERSIASYGSVLGARRLEEFDHVTPDGELCAVILDIPGVDVPVELRLDPATAARLAGFDPLTFTVTGRAELDGWIRHLDTLGVTHSPPIVAWSAISWWFPTPTVSGCGSTPTSPTDWAPNTWTSRLPGCAPTPCPPRMPDRP
ncbi:VOC family protein [Streptomyces sp. NPDC001848]|uniref:VOC family protein n=1 Tax=Streptomyces sp. NPDC001848 TaxID=3364618 RepID=UPI0036866629